MFDWMHDAYVQAAGMCVEKRGAMESIPLAKEVDERLGLALGS